MRLGHLCLFALGLSCVGHAPAIRMPADTRNACEDHLPPRVSRMSWSQYQNSLQDLLGRSGPVNRPEAHEVIAATSGQIEERDRDGVSSSLAFEYSLAAARTASQTAAGLIKAAGCLATDVDHEGCIQRTILRFAARAFGRPLTSEDASDLLEVYRTGRANGILAGVQLVLVAVLQSPSFLYRRELGEGGMGGARSLTQLELARQISFFLLDSVPDDSLWRAAEEGRLASDEQVARHVDRLLRLPRVQMHLTALFLGWLGTSRVLDRPKDPGLFPVFESDPSLRNGLHEETRLFVDALLWKDVGTLRDLILSPRTFVNQVVAKHYGVPYPGGGDDGFVPMTLPATERMGVLTQASFLAGQAGFAHTSVVHRGLFVRSRLLCLDEVPPPPPALSDAIKANAALDTERERAEFRMDSPRCTGCHGEIDPLGLVFENYDPIGRYRTRIGDAPIDASSELDFTPTLDGPVENALALAQKIAASPELRACATRRVLEMALGPPAAGAQAACARRDVERRFVLSGESLVELVRAAAISPAVRFRRSGVRP